MKYIIAFVFIGIIGALFAAGRAMLQNGKPGQPRNHRMVNALALRVGLSVTLFLFILLAWSLGWIHPTGLPAGR